MAKKTQDVHKQKMNKKGAKTLAPR